MMVILLEEMVVIKIVKKSLVILALEGLRLLLMFARIIVEME